jgi:hypothetical protein
MVDVRMDNTMERSWRRVELRRFPRSAGGLEAGRRKPRPEDDDCNQVRMRVISRTWEASQKGGKWECVSVQ